MSNHDADQTKRNNWLKVKAALEACGKTDNDYYRKAVSIINQIPAED